MYSSPCWVLSFNELHEVHVKWFLYTCTQLYIPDPEYPNSVTIIRKYSAFLCKLFFVVFCHVQSLNTTWNYIMIYFFINKNFFYFHSISRLNTTLFTRACLCLLMNLTPLPTCSMICKGKMTQQFSITSICIKANL